MTFRVIKGGFEYDNVLYKDVCFLFPLHMQIELKFKSA